MNKDKNIIKEIKRFINRNIKNINIKILLKMIRKIDSTEIIKKQDEIIRKEKFTNKKEYDSRINTKNIIKKLRNTTIIEIGIKNNQKNI
jgi:hypothetical protein